MARQINRLSPARVKHAKPGMHPDGGGLYLQVTVGKTGQINKSWLFRFRKGAKERQMGLGSTSTISLKDAREAAEKCRKLLLAGKDPIEARNAERAAQKVGAKQSITFERAAIAYMAAQEAGWRNAKHRAQWNSTLSTYAYPVIGNLAVGRIDTAHVLRIIQPIWVTKNEMILDWCKVNRHRDGDNPARWQGHLSHLLATFRRKIEVFGVVVNSAEQSKARQG